jgi:hypothetical protein
LCCGSSKKFVIANQRYWNTPSIASAIGVREDQNERDPKALAAYLNNVDVG